MQQVRYMSEGNPFFPLPSAASRGVTVPRRRQQQQQQQQQAVPYAQTVQDTVAGTLPSAISVATQDTRVQHIKVRFCCRASRSLVGLLRYSALATIIFPSAGHVIAGLSRSISVETSKRCRLHQLQLGDVSLRSPAAAAAAFLSSLTRVAADTPSSTKKTRASCALTPHRTGTHASSHWHSRLIALALTVACSYTSADQMSIVVTSRQCVMVRPLAA